MAKIIDQLDNLTDFPSAVDTFTNYRDGEGQSSCISATIVNKLEGALYRTQEYGQRVVRVQESASVTGDRKRLAVHATLTLAATVKFYEYDLVLSAEQVRFLGNSPFRPGNMLLVSVARTDAGGVSYRGVATPVGNDTLRIYLDNLDTSGSLTAGTYHLSVTILGG
jgi:hypothetical protein